MKSSIALFFGNIDSLNLDPANQRLRCHRILPDAPQETLLEQLAAWKLEELACSLLESNGLWTFEPLIVVQEQLYGKKNELVVVEGNRRLAALIYLRNTLEGKPPTRKWSEIVEDAIVPNDIFNRIPYCVAESREDLRAHLGIKHTKGPKQWDAAQRANHIAYLVDDARLSFAQTARRLGYSVPAIRHHYVAHHLLQQIKSTIDNFPNENVDCRFQVLYEAIQKTGVQNYLGIDLNPEPNSAWSPVRKKRLPQLSHFSRWVYGNAAIPPLVSDGEQTSVLGDILECSAATKYLENTDRPNLHAASHLARGYEQETLSLLRSASDQIEEALRTIHHVKKSTKIKKALEQIVKGSMQLHKAVIGTKVLAESE
jgi:hypothetical protein